MNKKKPRSLYEARILGSLLVFFILGLVIKNSMPLNYLLLILGPIIEIWFMKYDDAKYQENLNKIEKDVY
ncbi:hypothetical protein KJZ24_03655 [Enterococcus faecalis]|jgi:hypothetical protein|uniref:hypothetical protein n=1 Tax=Bacteria TaxID=2 RepID=UPI000330D290|nr:MULTISPECIES: hypothetical protein [Bacteria]EGO2619583.1 hypothetical protein [Enterococcus faecalis]EOJ29186.1 hypothetical protein UMU_01738 [Enterococcus faecalis EnGen0300]EOJ69796.1 hypothetical protein WMU_01961 [Enterococcus faecalis EnGen0351]EOL89088.1 hypothetical protein WM3_02495 [Enterococcus faecalis EnGen0366]MBG8798872.1 hypothetical protein [Salmonella enterica subsp. enterica]